MRRDGPAVAEWIFKLTIAVAPKHILEGHLHGRACIHRPRERGIRVPDEKMDGYGRAIVGLWSQRTHFGKLIVQHDDGIANLDRGMQEPSIGRGQSHQLDGSERFFVELDGVRRAGAYQIRRYGMEAFWDRSHR